MKHKRFPPLKIHIPKERDM